VAHIPIWIAAALLGALAARRGTSRVAWAASLVLAFGSALYLAAYFPDEITRSLTRLPNEPAPVFALAELDGDPYPVDSLRGRVVVLDFFATWCAPCVAEMPELETLQRRHAADDDVVILVVANDSGGDSPQATGDFRQRRQIALDFAYDAGGAAHRAFGFLGLPGLVMIDCGGNVRLAREGFNEAEDDLAGFLAETIESLLAEAS